MCIGAGAIAEVWVEARRRILRTFVRLGLSEAADAKANIWDRLRLFQRMGGAQVQELNVRFLVN